MKARQFVDVVMRRYGRGSSWYTVSRVKAEEHLFYGSTAEAQAAAVSPPSELNTVSPSSSAVLPPWMESISRMPPPRLRFDRSISDSDDNRLDFLPFHRRGGGGASTSKVLCVDAAGHTVLYDIDAGSLQPIPCLSSPKGDRPIGFSTADPDASDDGRAYILHVMCNYPTSRNPYNFEALKYSDPSNGGKLEGWHWHRLLAPPSHINISTIRCHALLDIDGDPIFAVSSSQESGIGTHCFNTVTSAWFKAGDWTLPFFSHAEQVPELDNLWFGIGNCRPNHFYAMDLSSIRPDRAPLLLYGWQELDLPEDWVMLDCSFVYLGAGRFCITKIFEFGEDEDTGHTTEMGAVMSGVEVVRSKKTLRMVKHKSRFYNFVKDDIVCAL